MPQDCGKREAMSRYLSRKEFTYNQINPVGQDRHTGLWGFDRVGGCLNLKRCIYKTRRSATLARKKTFAAQEETPTI